MTAPRLILRRFGPHRVEARLECAGGDSVTSVRYPSWLTLAHAYGLAPEPRPNALRAGARYEEVVWEWADGAWVLVRDTDPAQNGVEIG